MGYDAIRKRQKSLPGTLGVTDFRNDVISPSSVAKSDYEKFTTKYKFCQERMGL